MEEREKIDVHPITRQDRTWVEAFYLQRWGSSRVVTRGRLHNVHELPGFVAWLNATRSGLLTYRAGNDELEIVTLDSLEPGRGVGTALISAARDFALEGNYHRLWLITTNDNTPALRFYQMRGFSIVKIHLNSITGSRKIKPEIPLTGLDGIPIRDEIELEIVIT